MKRLLPLIFLCAHAAIASDVTTDKIVSPQGLTIQDRNSSFTFPNGNYSEQVLTQSSPVYKQVKAVYDFPFLGGASAANIALTPALPKGAIISKVTYDVVTQPTSGSTTATVGLTVQSASDILADTALASLTTGQALAKPDGTAAKMIKLTAAANPTVNVKLGALTAGRIIFYFDLLY